MKDYRDCDPEVVEGLFQLATAAQGACPIMFSGGDELTMAAPNGIDPVDLESLVAALHVLRPGLPSLALYDALLHMMRGRWQEATQTLYQSIAAGGDFRYGKALLAFCLCQLGDSGWRPIAQDVLQGDASDHAARFVLATDAYVSFRDGTPPLVPASAAISETDDMPHAPAKISPEDTIVTGNVGVLRA